MGEIDIYKKPTLGLVSIGFLILSLVTHQFKQRPNSKLIDFEVSENLVENLPAAPTIAHNLRLHQDVACNDLKIFIG